MLYYLFDWIHQTLKPPGFGVFKYLTFRSALAAITALVFSLYLGPKIIARLKAMQIREEKKVDAPKRHLSKAGTPTMGGLIVLCATLGPVLLWGDLKSIFIILICSGTFVLGAVGFLDDYLKVIKKLPNGLIGRYKILGQVIAGIFIGTMVYVAPEFHPFNTVTTMPFLKNINFDFSIFYIPIVVFIITATSNAVNLTDGLDGLAIGLTTIAMLAMALICYVTGNAVYAHYLNIVFIKGSGELVVFIAALIGAGLGFLWFNSYPAQVFMGDTGSLALGGAFGILSVLVKKELFIPLLGGIFFLEASSVIIQKVYFKYTKKKYGAGKRIFRMAPVHHHFELSGIDEPKIVTRFYIVAIILAIITLASFKVR